jgi:hypothetical protein
MLKRRYHAVSSFSSFIFSSSISYLSVCLTVIPSSCLSVCHSFFLSACLSVIPSSCLSVCPSFLLPVCLAVRHSFFLSVCLSACHSSCLLVCLSVPPYHSTFSPLNIPPPTSSLSGGYRRMDSSGTVPTDEGPPQLPRVRGRIQGERGGQESGEISLCLTEL